MLLISEIYDDVALDSVNSSENGQLNFPMFNRLSRRAELRLLDFLTSDVENIKPPTDYTSTKVKDWASPFIIKYPKQVINGKIPKPVNYYGFENMYLLGQFNVNTNCYEIVEDGGVKCNTPIELLNGDVFTERCRTYIEGLQPSFSKPISKLVGSDFEYNPIDLGSLVLEYIRYPVFGKIVSKMDTVYNEEVIDEALSTNYEWNEYARELLCFFIADTFAIHTRETALKQQLKATGALVRDAKQ